MNDRYATTLKHLAYFTVRQDSGISCTCDRTNCNDVMESSERFEETLHNEFLLTAFKCRQYYW